MSSLQLKKRMCDCIRNLYLILGNFNNGEQQNTSKQTKTHIHLKKKTKYILSVFVISCQNMQFYFLIFFIYVREFYCLLVLVLSTSPAQVGT